VPRVAPTRWRQRVSNFKLYPDRRQLQVRRKCHPRYCSSSHPKRKAQPHVRTASGHASRKTFNSTVTDKGVCLFLFARRFPPTRLENSQGGHPRHARRFARPSGLALLTRASILRSRDHLVRARGTRRRSRRTRRAVASNGARHALGTHHQSRVPRISAGGARVGVRGRGVHRAVITRWAYLFRRRGGASRAVVTNRALW